MAADIGFIFGNSSTLVNSLLAYDPGSVIYDFPFAGVSVVPMVGTAPGAEIYAMKVFSAFGSRSTPILA